jgi:UDP-3-O-[3-hydroxymyristoyl] glucosamine N-acyltransferase
LELTLSEIARIIKGRIIGDERLSITGVNALDKASPGDISFFFDNRYRDFVKDTRASALIVSEPINDYEGPQIVVSDPKLAYIQVAESFAPPVARFDGVSSNAVIETTSTIGKNASIYPMVYVGKEAVIGDDVILYPGTFIGDRVRIGDRTVIYPNVSIMRDCIIGRDVVIQAGCVIGSDGFGFVRDGGENIKFPQLGIVQIDDKVEIGANTTIDRAANGKTLIQKGVKLDNLIQIAHNVTIGEDTVIAALTGISGSVRIGREVIIGGQTGFKDHIEIGDRAVIGSAAGVHKSIPAGETVLGDPAMPPKLWMRTRALIAKLPEINERLRNLEKKLPGSEKSDE